MNIDQFWWHLALSGKAVDHSRKRLIIFRQIRHDHNVLKILKRPLHLPFIQSNIKLDPLEEVQRVRLPFLTLQVIHICR